GLHARTVEYSFGRHASRQLSDKVFRYLKHAVTCATSDFLGGGPRSLATSSRRREGRTVSSSRFREVRRAVSEGSDLLRDRPSLRIVRTSRLLPQWVLEDSRMFPHIAEFCDPLGRGS